MVLIVLSAVLSTFFMLVGVALFYIAVMEPFLEVLIGALALSIYGVFCLVCVKRLAKDRSKFYASAPICLGSLLGVALGPLGLYSGIETLIELCVLLTLQTINGVLIRKIGFTKST